MRYLKAQIWQQLSTVQKWLRDILYLWSFSVTQETLNYRNKLLHMQVIFTLKFINVAPHLLFKCSQIFSLVYMISTSPGKKYVNLRSTMGPSEFGRRANISVLKINMSIRAFFLLETYCTWRLDSQISPQKFVKFILFLKHSINSTLGPTNMRNLFLLT